MVIISRNGEERAERVGMRVFVIQEERKRPREVALELLRGNENNHVMQPKSNFFSLGS